MSKWYVTIDKQSSYIDDPDECVWTVSRDPNTTGWCTDSGYSGYGLTKADAEELANAANEIERLRKIIAEHELWKEAPCCLCGYNGPNYFQPSIHKCAALQQKESE